MTTSAIIGNTRLHHIGPKDPSAVFEILDGLLDAFRQAGEDELAITAFLMRATAADHDEFVRMVFCHVDFDTSDE